MITEFRYGRAIGDPEKTVLPTIIFMNTNHHSFGDVKRSGWVLIAGWWDFWCGFTFISNRKP